MRVVISEQLQAYLRQQERSALTLTLERRRCCGGMLFEVSVAPQAPKGPARSASLVQNDLCISYSHSLAAGQHAWNWMMYGPSSIASRS
jgi:hypothetical protein